MFWQRAILSFSILALGQISTVALAGDGGGGDGGAADGKTWSCKRPRVLIVLDKSSSMVTGMVGSQTKWDVAKSALSTILNTYETNIDFGLMIFPFPSQCGTGKGLVGIGPSNAQAILTQLATPPPTAGNWTPMAQSLQAAGTMPNLQDKSYSNNVLLITDGWQWCSPYDVSTRFLPVNATLALTQAGITTYVVGFGDAVDVLTLNKMAAAAGTQISSSCNPSSSSLTATDNCYYQASMPQDLLNALKKIALILTSEKCDGLDNDCNGKTDDGLTRACSSKCGSGLETCTMGQWGGCTAPQPQTEKCDGKDNNCDGTVDEGCACKQGETRSCGLATGQCKPGTQVCTSGTWSGCTGQVKPSTEACDGKDNDCNGKTDENLSRVCTSKCGKGTETCVGGTYKHCTAPQPTKEICDGLDNDCDKVVDGPSAICANGGVCISGICQSRSIEPPPDSGHGPGLMLSEPGCDCELGAEHRSGSAAGGSILIALALMALATSRRRRQP